MPVLDRLKETMRTLLRGEPPIDEYIHADIKRIMQKIIKGMPEYKDILYKESLVPDKNRANGEGLGITEYGNWRNIFNAIEAEVHKAERAKPYTKPAYEGLETPASDKQASLSKSLSDTRELMANRILKDVANIPVG